MQEFINNSTEKTKVETCLQKKLHYNSLPITNIGLIFYLLDQRWVFEN